jgi:ArsR family transcriptional regulator, arsenate/arsenite/antimonite-responsive transcriptional repressor
MKMIEVFKALSDRNRIRIVNALEHNGELCACQITELLGVSGATASKHLSILVRCGLLSSRKDGRWVHFKLAKSVLPDAIFKWIRSECQCSDILKADLKKLSRGPKCD